MRLYELLHKTGGAVRRLRARWLAAPLLVFFLAGLAGAQSNLSVNPDCIQNFTVAVAGVSNAYDNRFSACTVWILAYSNSGFSVVSITLQSAPSAAGGTSPDTFVTFDGTVTSGTNPQTAITQSSAMFSGFNPWLRVNFGTLTGSGFVNAVLYGYRANAASAATTSCGAVGNPCVVVGKDANAAAASGSPVLVAGYDGAVVRRILTDTSGNLFGVSFGPDAVGVAPTKNPISVAGIDGTGVTQRALMDTTGRFNVNVGNLFTGGDAVSNTQLQSPAAGAYRLLMTAPATFNGTSWDRLRGDTSGRQFVIPGQLVTGQDAKGNTAIVSADFTSANERPLSVALSAFEPSSGGWYRVQGVGASSLDGANAQSGVGGRGLITEKFGRRSAMSNPAAGSQATASLAAVGSGYNIVDCITFSAGSTTAPALTALTVNLRDGATGAGTILMSWQVVISAATGQNVPPFEMCGLQRRGTLNTAMTLEFSAALANLIQAVAITGTQTL